MMDLLLQGQPAAIPSDYQWLGGLLAGGGTSAIMGFIIWHVFSKMIPAFTAAIEKQRADSIGILEKQRQLDRDENTRTRAEFLVALDKLQSNFREDLGKERQERKDGSDKVVAALKEQTVLLAKLAGNHTTPP